MPTNLGWNIEFTGAVQLPGIIRGWTYLPPGSFENDLKAWQTQVCEHLSPANVGPVLYWEMVDWLDDMIVEEQINDEDIHFVEVSLGSDGKCVVSWPEA